MKTAWRLETARQGQGRLVAELVGRSLAPSLRRLTIWESPRAGCYVESALGEGTPGEGRRFYLLRRGEQTAGLAAFRMLDGEPFLNHLYIAPRFRRQGLGAWLLAEGARRYLDEYRGERVGLEVFAGRPAEAWYARLGFFERGAASGWWIAPASGAGHSAGARCRGLLEAGCRHRAWGFSRFIAETSRGRSYAVGRLWAPYFRLGEVEAAADGRLLGALRRLDPRRGLLVVGPGELGYPPWKRVAVSRRLEIRAETLLGRLVWCPALDLTTALCGRGSEIGASEVRALASGMRDTTARPSRNQTRLARTGLGAGGRGPG